MWAFLAIIVLSGSAFDTIRRVESKFTGVKYPEPQRWTSMAPHRRPHHATPKALETDCWESERAGLEVDIWESTREVTDRAIPRRRLASHPRRAEEILEKRVHVYRKERRQRTPQEEAMRKEYMKKMRERSLWDKLVSPWPKK